MAVMIEIKSMVDARGALTVADREIPFGIRRVFFITGVPETETRGRHGHRRARLALIAAAGRCEVLVRRAGADTVFDLDRPTRCLLLDPEDWHLMSGFRPHTVLAVLASEHYDSDDYIFDPV